LLCLFLTFERAPAQMPRFDNALAHTPERARDPYLDDGAPPALVVQAHFASLKELEAAAQENAALQCAAQAFSVTVFPVPHPGARRERYCSYLVTYDGPAEDAAAWHAYYLAHHPPLMAKLPGIRALEIYRPVAWRSPQGWEQRTCLQRNKVVFDDTEALSAALDSPVRREMRADFARLPRFSGRVTHFAMTTEALR
jgi:uncharacterized protein (TIGR02118 family)